MAVSLCQFAFLGCAGHWVQFLAVQKKKNPQAYLWTSNSSFLPLLTPGHPHSTLCFLSWLSGCLVEDTSHSMSYCVTSILHWTQCLKIYSCWTSQITFPSNAISLCACILFSHLSMEMWIVSLSCSKPYGCAHIFNSLGDFQGFFHSSYTILLSHWECTRVPSRFSVETSGSMPSI